MKLVILLIVFFLSIPIHFSNSQSKKFFSQNSITHKVDQYFGSKSPDDFSQPVNFEPQYIEPGFFDLSQPLQLSNNDVIMFWALRDQNSPPATNNIIIKLSRSTNGGLNWYSTSDIAIIENNYLDSLIIMAEVTNSGRIVFIFSKSSFTQSNRFFKMFSDDNGYTWTAPLLVGTGIGAIGRNATLSKMIDSSIWLTYNKSATSIGIRISNDDGNTWNSEIQLPAASYNRLYPSAFSIDSQNKAIVFQSDVAGTNNIYITRTSNDGINWSDTIHVLNTVTENLQPRGVRNAQGDIWIVYQALTKQTYHTWNNYLHSQSNIHFIKSTDSGTSWSQPNEMTTYSGTDQKFAVKIVNNSPFISFISNRYLYPSYNYYLWYGVAELTTDYNAPPTLGTHFVFNQTANQPVQVNAIILNNSPLSEVKVLYRVNDQFPFQEVTMHDDGLHNDGDPNDNLWSAEIGPFQITDRVFYKFFVKDSVGNQLEFYGWTLTFLNYLTEGHIIDVNNFNIPVDNYGKISDVEINGTSYYGTYEAKRILFTGGFFLSGFANDTLWANGVMSASRISDYLPGPVGEIPSPLHGLYVVNFDDEPFSESWQNWTMAVEYGADFFDGNGDGLYDPADLNNNGIWDPDEDRPGLIGNETVFTVFNDNVPSNLRRFSNMNPQGVEIQQTAFAFSNEEYSLNNTIFIKYKIVNKSQNDWDSLFFSAAADPDIGDYTDDLSGYDSVSNSGYAYNESSDPIWGSSPPAFFQSLILGPVVFIPGETFIDNNANGIFDPGIDMPIDTAYNIRGHLMGIDTIPGAKNIQLTSFTNYHSSDQFHGDPNVVSELRQYQIGGRKNNGELIDPCTWPYGTVFGVDCNLVNPLFMYSGDPETQTGWLHTQESDVRHLQSFGPLTLKQGEHIEILLAYLVGRNTSSLNSVTLTKQKVMDVIYTARNNFPVTVVSVEDNETEVLTEFELYQNYPNPFNPSTVIRYRIPEAGFVSLKVYDILGREVAILVNEVKSAGKYEIEFNIHQTLDNKQLSSGVYFYQLKAGNYTRTLKMSLVK